MPLVRFSTLCPRLLEVRFETAVFGLVEQRLLAAFLAGAHQYLLLADKRVVQVHDTERDGKCWHARNGENDDSD